MPSAHGADTQNQGKSVTTEEVTLNQYETISGYDIQRDVWKIITNFTDYKHTGSKCYQCIIDIPQGSTKEQMAKILEKAIIKLRNG